MKKSWHLSRRETLKALAASPLAFHSLSQWRRLLKPTVTHVGPKRLACVFSPTRSPAIGKGSSPYRLELVSKGRRKEFHTQQVHRILRTPPSRHHISFWVVPSAGRHMAGHGVSDVFLTAGPVDANSYQNTISFNQLVAEKHGRDTRLPFLPLSVGGGVGTLGRTHTLSYTKTGQPIPAK